MKFLYKIWSNYDGFTPREIPNRLDARGRVSLGWDRYIDVVELGHEVWIYFHGRRVNQPGVYARGLVQEIDQKRNSIIVRLREHEQDHPLTDPKTSEQIAEVVAARGLQVFVYPEAWVTRPDCDLRLAAKTCKARECDSCPIWKRLPRVAPEARLAPRRFPDGSELIPAYWVIPRRCYLHRDGVEITRGILQSSEVFYRFKFGERNLAHPLALGIYEALRVRQCLDFDCVVPIPLSPDKADMGEIDRARLLAGELARLLGIRVGNFLSLKEPISKHRLRTQGGLSASRFEEKYSAALTVSDGASTHDRILLVDDVVTEGSTLRCAVQGLREANPQVAVVAATAGQMILRQVVADESTLVDSRA